MIDLLIARKDLFKQALATRALLGYARTHQLNLSRISFFAGITAVAQIIDCGNHRFDFGDDHSEAVPGFVCEAFAEDGETVIDLVAWPISRPDRPMTMFGRCGLLGLWEAMNPATFIFDKPINFHLTPLDWLKAGCSGAALVDPRVAAWALLDIPGRIAGQDQPHSRQLLELAETVIDRSRFVAPSR